jgi:hypothetical protein
MTHGHLVHTDVAKLNTITKQMFYFKLEDQFVFMKQYRLSVNGSFKPTFDG